MGITLEQLRCESLTSPLGLDELRPRLSWVLRADRRNVMQSAYEILVASTETDLTPERALWTTGRVVSGQSVNLEYAGPALRSRQRYFWQVRIWDEQDQASPWSEPAHWEMGLLGPKDWQARWTEPTQQPVTAEPKVSLFEAMASRGRSLDELRELPRHLHPCPHLRRVFELPAHVQRARLYVTARGLYHLELNGQRVHNLELTPENTTYPSYQMYQTFDVGQHLRVGANALGAILSDGWYAGRSAAAGESQNFGDRLALLFQLEAELEDGTSVVIASDGQLRSSVQGPLVYSDLFIGERFDARLCLPNWSMPDFDDSTWDAVNVLEMSDPNNNLHNLVAQYGEPVRVVQELPVQNVLRTPKGETVLDFGQVIAGRVRMRVSGPAATEVALEHSEVLDADGNFFRNIVWRNKEQTDVFVLRGASENTGQEVHQPLFAFHGFRYVKLTNYPGEVHAENFTALVLGSDLELAGFFETSDPRLNQLQHNIVWSQRGNFLSIPTDCPQRERTGWTGDIQVFAPTAVFNMRVQAFLTRWLRLVQLEQRPNGEVPYHVPTTPSMAPPFKEHSSAGWGDACLIVPWVLYQEYADERVLRENHATMTRWVGYIQDTARNGLPLGLDPTTLGPEALERQQHLWNTGFHFGDWLIPSIPNLIEGAHATKELVGTVFYAHSTRLLARICKKLGKHEEAERYAEQSRNTCQAFAEEYLLPDGRLRADFQGSYVLALHFGLVPKDRQAQVFAQLVRLIETNNHRLDTGFMSVPFLLDVLCDHGRTDLAYRLLFQTECPSWLYAVERGATTIWEAWDAILPSGEVRPGSYNHYAFGCVGDWMYRHLAGLVRVAASEKKFVVQPHVDCGLTWVQAHHETVYGMLESRWQRDGNRVSLHVTIPSNTTAVVHLPAQSNAIEMDGVAFVAATQATQSIKIGSGTYRFAFQMPSNGASRG